MERAPKLKVPANNEEGFEGFEKIEKAKEIYGALKEFNGQTLVGDEGEKVEGMSRELHELLRGMPREVREVHDLPWHPLDASEIEESVV